MARANRDFTEVPPAYFPGLRASVKSRPGSDLSFNNGSNCIATNAMTNLDSGT